MWEGKGGDELKKAGNRERRREGTGKYKGRRGEEERELGEGREEAHSLDLTHQWLSCLTPGHKTAPAD